ncbi:hypothetical protein GCM10018790_09530 [Kitasatospora xanthocidica]|nr:hypothetical protein GCM10018790_09530 [Kitasatospora xanthocidica]
MFDAATAAGVTLWSGAGAAAAGRVVVPSTPRAAAVAIPNVAIFLAMQPRTVVLLTERFSLNGSRRAERPGRPGVRGRR